MTYETYLLDAADLILAEPYVDSMTDRALGDTLLGWAQALCHRPGE